MKILSLLFEIFALGVLFVAIVVIGAMIIGAILFGVMFVLIAAVCLSPLAWGYTYVKYRRYKARTELAQLNIDHKV